MAREPVRAGVSRVELRIRGVPEWLLRAYLAELGAVADDDTDDGEAPRMTGDGYAVTWSTGRRCRVAR